MHFDDVIGQKKVKTALRQMVLTDRMPHALLFTGPAGSGKLAMSLAFAQYVLCRNKSEEGACNSCGECRKVSGLIHPDLHLSFPVIGTNVKSDDHVASWREAILQNPYLDVNDWLAVFGEENKQGNINKEECLNIIRKLSLKIFQGSHKILIMWLPEYLGKEGNRLLKIIEEPPENTLFILVTENQDLILNTIISRCQLVQFSPLSDDEISQALMGKKAYSNDQAQKAAQLAEGNFNEALKYAEQKENDFARLFLEWLRKCFKGDGVQLVNWVADFAPYSRENKKQFLSYALHFMREYLLLKTASGKHLRLLKHEMETAEKLKKVISFEQVAGIVELLNEVYYHVERNANPKTLFLDASIKINNILKGID